MRNERIFILLCALGLCMSVGTAASAQSGPPAAGPSLVPDAQAVNARASRASLGTDLGLWGTGFAHGIRLDLPVFKYWGVRVRGAVAYGPPTADDFDPAVLGGLELFGRGPVLLGLVRVYGGGGVYAGGRPHRVGGGRSYGVSGGGHMGVEIFGLPWLSWFVEVGGQGAVHAKKIDAGPSVLGGLQLYF